MSIVLIAGGTGLIGKKLSDLLKAAGHEVRHLSRKENLNATFPAYRWDLSAQEIDEKALSGVDYIINMAGAGIADKPWTSARKQLIIESRTQSTKLLKTAIKTGKVNPKAYIASAAIGIYGDRGEELLTEDSSAGKSGFLAESCKQWEAAINTLSETGVRTVAIRIGLVLANEGGALPKMTMSLPIGVAPYFGNGKQWYSWIHIEDIARMFIQAIENENLSGYYNGVAPNPERNKAMMQKMVKVSKKRALVIPTPKLALRTAMGELADVVLTGAKISAEKMLDTGFKFKFPTLEEAFGDLLR